MDALQNLMDDMEYSSYYGRGEDPAVAARPKQKGLRTLLTANLTLNPVNAGAYKPTDLIRDTMQQCRVNGGDPDVLLVSSNFMTGLATWGMAVQKIDAGVNVFGTPIDVFEAPFLGGVSIIEAPLLKPSTAVCLTSSEVRMRMKRNEFWNPRGDPRRRLRRRLDRRGGDRGRQPVPPRLGRGDHGVLGHVSFRPRAARRRPGAGALTSRSLLQVTHAPIQLPRLLVFLEDAARQIGHPEAARRRGDRAPVGAREPLRQAGEPPTRPTSRGSWPRRRSFATNCAPPTRPPS